MLRADHSYDGRHSTELCLQMSSPRKYVLIEKSIMTNSRRTPPHKTSRISSVLAFDAVQPISNHTPLECLSRYGTRYSYVLFSSDLFLDTRCVARTWHAFLRGFDWSIEVVRETGRAPQERGRRFTNLFSSASVSAQYAQWHRHCIHCLTHAY